MNSHVFAQRFFLFAMIGHRAPSISLALAEIYFIFFPVVTVDWQNNIIWCLYGNKNDRKCDNSKQHDTIFHSFGQRKTYEKAKQSI